MKLLVDSCVWKGAGTELAAAGHDVVWVGDWPADPGDEEILACALREARVVVTLDKDFGELAVAFGHEHAGSSGWSVFRYGCRQSHAWLP